MTAINGWTAERLYDLKQTADTTRDKVTQIERDLVEIKQTLRHMESEETQTLRERVRELEEQPKRQVQAIIVPFICACIPAAVLLVSHA